MSRESMTDALSLSAIAAHIVDAVYQDARDHDADDPESFEQWTAEQAIAFYIDDECRTMRFQVGCNKEDRIKRRHYLGLISKLSVEDRAELAATVQACLEATLADLVEYED